MRTGSAPARFGANGLVEGTARKQGTDTTPTGLYGLPYAFGIKAAPRGTAYTYRRVHRDSWWCQDNDSRSYNRWTEPRAADCRAAESEQLISYRAQYAHALVIDFNYERPVRGRGAGIFLHVNGRGATAALRLRAEGRDAADPHLGRPGEASPHRRRDDERDHRRHTLLRRGRRAGTCARYRRSLPSALDSVRG